MKKPLKKQFTFGFELEGAFKQGINIKLRETLPDYVSYNFKSDGSVDVNPNFFDNGFAEINVGVFKSLEDLLKALALFKKTNYAQNETCGLHIHIKPKGKDSLKLRSCISDYQFLRKIERFAEKNLCEQVARRLKGDGRRLVYCKRITPFKKTRDCFTYHDKYVWLRNHPSGTFEFRFFDTCENKDKEVKKFFNYFFKELKKVKPLKEKEIMFSEDKEQKLDIIEKLSEKRKLLDIIERLEYQGNKKLNITI